MSVVSASHASTHELPGARFTTLVAPSTGSREMSVWRVEIASGSEPTPHLVTREEVFLVLTGRARIHLEGEVSEAGPGDAIVVPAEKLFALSNAGEDVLTMFACLPVGGQARLPESEPFTPPWAL